MEKPALIEQVASPESSESVELSERQQQILGCLACISSCEEGYASEATRQIVTCTTLDRNKVSRGLVELRDQELIDVRPRTQRPKPGTLGPSLNEHGLTQAGKNFLPSNWKPCANQDERSPLENLTKLQSSFLRCISCLAMRGKDPTTIDIANCTNRTIGTVQRMLDKIVQQDLLTRSTATNRLRQQGGNVPLSYAPTPKAVPYMPKEPLIFDCRQFNNEAEKLYASLTASQRQALGCIACQSGKVKRGEIASVENSYLAQCQDIPPRTMVDITARLVELGIIEIEGGYNKTRNRSVITPTDLGRRLFTITTHADTCRTATSIENHADAIHLEKAVTKCLGCIWTKQVASEEKPAASTSMVSHCSGLPLKTVQGVVRRMAEDGKLKRTMSGRNLMLNKALPTATYSPTTYLRALPKVGGKHCKLPLYKDVPPHFLRPLSATVMTNPPRDESAAFFKSTWFRRGLLHDLLSAEDEVRLAQVIHGPDPQKAADALNTFIEQNFKLALWGATQAKADRIFLPFEDALLAAHRAIGLAAVRFDPDQGTKFSTYAFFWLRKVIQREAANYIGVPQHDYVFFPKIYYSVENFKKQYDRMPSIIELAHDLQIRPQQVNRILQRRQHAVDTTTLRLDSFLDDDERKTTYQEIVRRNNHDFERVDLMASVERLKKYLSPTETDFLINIVQDMGLTGNAIVAKHGKTSGSSRKMRNKVASFIRHPYFGILASVDDSFAWQAEAACSTQNHDRVVRAIRGTVSRTTREVCQSCPVNEQCDTFARTASPPVTAGVWNGNVAAQLEDS